MEAVRSVLISCCWYNSPLVSYPHPKPLSLSLVPQPSLLFRRHCRRRHSSAGEVLQNPPNHSLPPPSPAEFLPKIDKSGRFCSPRAARELALSIIYAACLEGSDPVRLFEKRLNFPREPGYEFDRTLLNVYSHMSFAGPPVNTNTVEEAGELRRDDEKESAIEAEVLSAPPKLVYSKLILRFTRKLLVAVVEKWNSHVLVIDKVAPSNWKSEPASRILEFSILHLAMSEIAVLGTRHPIVINEVNISTVFLLTVLFLPVRVKA